MSQVTKPTPPPAPKGNQYAIGNRGQPPFLYTEEWMQEEACLLREWMQCEDALYLKSFCVERGYSAQRLSEFSAKSPEFAEALALAKEWLECRLVHLGLWNKTNSSMTKFVLTNCHHWKEQPYEVFRSPAIPPEAINTSADLVLSKYGPCDRFQALTV